jgi:hypothetical protein
MRRVDRRARHAAVIRSLEEALGRRPRTAFAAADHCDATDRHSIAGEKLFVDFAGCTGEVVENLSLATRSGPSASFLNPVDSPVCRRRLFSLAIAGYGQEQSRLTAIGWLLGSPPFCHFLLRPGWFLHEAAFQGSHQIAALTGDFFAGFSGVFESQAFSLNRAKPAGHAHAFSMGQTRRARDCVAFG